MQRQQEQPTFAAGDRFRLRQTITALDITREEEASAEDMDATFWDYFPAGLKGRVVKQEVWFQDPDDPADLTLCFTLQLDTCPERKIFYIGEEDHGGPFEQVAAKAITLN